jgi:hypothetical protein
MHAPVWLISLISALCFTVGPVQNNENASLSFSNRSTYNFFDGQSILKKNFHIIYTDPIVTSDSSFSIIPFTRAGNLILIQAKADTTRGFFILDTGAPNLVLNTTYFRKYASTSTTDNAGITGPVEFAQQINIDSFSFGFIKYYHLTADMINLGHIENSKGVKIFGLLGMQLFERFEMMIDYQKSLIYLHLISKKDKATYKSEWLKDTTTYSTVLIDIVEHKIIAHAETANKKLKFIIDSGAETNVLDSRLPNKVFENVIITKRVTLSGSGNKKVEALYGDLKNIKIGNQSTTNLPVLITNLEQMCLAYNYCIDGVLGFDFLSLHKIGFNFVDHKMFIWK